MAYVIGTPGPRPDPKIIESLRTIEPATLGHVFFYGFMDASIRPVFRRVNVVGPALTVRSPGPDGTAIHYALSLVQPGDVLVIDRAGDMAYACFGEMTARAAKQRGAAGVIADGLVTDIIQIEEIGVPVYARGASARTGRLLNLGGEINTAVTCGGVTVRPGDLIHADDNGILVIPIDDAARAVEVGLQREARSFDLRRWIDEGKDLAEFSGAKRLVEGDSTKHPR
jgi:4-hydroxy-4-methyl-2-oxoglutarate aldolase